MSVSVGDAAPAFELDGTDGTEDGTRRYTLADSAGKPLVLVFYPGDDTPVCTRQLNTYTSEFDQFTELDAEVLALSPQGIDSHMAFAEAQGGFAFPLLADTDKAVGAAYGVVGPIGFYRRSVFVIDGEGTIRYAHRAVAGLTFRPTAEIVEALRSLPG
jgi:thioredoxin-dependent peroxiredoxin